MQFSLSERIASTLFALFNYPFCLQGLLANSEISSDRRGKKKWGSQKVGK